MRVVAMAGSVSGSNVRTQKRFCGLWMGCTVGLGPAGRDRTVAGLKVTAGWRAPWWQAREGPGLGVCRAPQEPSQISPSPSPYLVRRLVSAGYPHAHRLTHPRQGTQWEEEPPPKSGCQRSTLTMLSTGKAIAGIIPGNRHRLPTHFSVNVELLGQCVDHHRQVLLPHLGQREMAHHMGSQAPCPPAPVENSPR